MRLLLGLFLGCLLAGCASALPADPAALTFVAGDRSLDRGSGILAVDDSYFPGGPVTFATPEAGRHKISYNCPGYIFVDAPPEVWHKFRGGVHYEMFCKNGQPAFRIGLGPNNSFKPNLLRRSA